LHKSSFLRIKIAISAININGTQMAKLVLNKAILPWQIAGAKAEVNEAPRE
jgi:hypothetical protein